MRVPLGNDVFEANLVADFVAEAAIALGRDARGQQTGGEPARLKNHHLSIAQQAMIEQNLRDLGRFAGTGGRLEDEAGMRFELGDELVLQFENGQVLASHWEGKFNLLRDQREAESTLAGDAKDSTQRFMNQPEAAGVFVERTRQLHGA